MQIDFKKFKLFDSPSHERSAIVDVRQELADGIYNATNGIAALDLAFKIYRSDGPLEISEQEMQILTAFVETGRPAFIDSFRANVVEKPEDNS